MVYTVVKEILGMPNWLLILILVVVVVGAVFLFLAMFTEMGTKRETGKMKGGKASSSESSGRGGSKTRKKKSRF